MIAGLAALPLCACQTLPRVAAPEPMAPPPVSVDDAIRARQWDPTVAAYSSGGVWAWPNYITFHPDPLESPYNIFLETDFFLLNVGYSPYPAWVTDPMWKMVVYQQLTMDPTYTAMPALPAPATLAPTSELPATRPINGK